MYVYLILATVLLAGPFYSIVAKRRDAGDDNASKSDLQKMGFLVTCAGISGAFFAVVLICYLCYSHLWLFAGPVLSGGSVYSLFREHRAVVQAKLSLFLLGVGLVPGLAFAPLLWLITFRIGIGSIDYYAGVSSYDNFPATLRTMAVSALGKTGDERAVDPLCKALAYDDSNVRRRAATVLGELGDKRGVDPLIKALAHDDYLLRSDAAEALGRLGDKRAVKPLIAALSDERDWVRWRTVDALVRLGDVSVDPLIEALADGDSNVSRAVHEALERLRLKKLFE